MRGIAVADAAALAAYRERNAVYLEPWEPKRDAGFLTLAYQTTEIERSIADAGATLSRFVVRERAARDATDPIVASINLSNIRRGANESAIVSYSVDEAHTRRGYASEMLAVIVRHAFDDLRLHRLEASYQPSNHASARVLQKAGFAVEGYARDYLFIAGNWTDGVLTSLSNAAWGPAAAAP